MKSWLITIGEPLSIVENVRKHRTGILADQLVKRGHSVRWWVSGFEHQRRIMRFGHDQELSVPEGYVLDILHGCGYKKNVSLKRIIDHYIISKKFKDKARLRDRPDVIIVSLPCHHLAYEAVSFAFAEKIPILVDIRDLWPDIFMNAFRNPFLKKVANFSLSNDFRKLRYLLQHANGIVAVSDGYLKWGLNYAQRAKGKWDRVFFLGYESSHIDASDASCNFMPTWLQPNLYRKILCFIGTFGISYDLKLILQVAKRMLLEGKEDFCFVLAGTGEQEKELRLQTQGLSNVLMPGWINADEIRVLIKRSYAGLLPYIKNAPQGIPNKLFEYLSAGLPLISSLEGEMTDIIKHHDLGLNYMPGDAESLYHCIINVGNNKSLHDEFSKGAISFFVKNGDADSIYSGYVHHIENMVESNRLQNEYERREKV